VHNLAPGPWRLAGGTGDLTSRSKPPGDLKRLRIGAHYRPADAKDASTSGSFDDGKTYKTSAPRRPTQRNSATF